MPSRYPIPTQTIKAMEKTSSQQWYENSKKFQFSEDMQILVECYGMTQDIYNNASDVFERNCSGDWENFAKDFIDCIEKLQDEILQHIRDAIYEELSFLR